jgi:hypothetical protein
MRKSKIYSVVDDSQLEDESQNDNEKKKEEGVLRW